MTGIWFLPQSFGGKAAKKGAKSGPAKQYAPDKNPQNPTIPAKGYTSVCIKVAASQTTHQFITENGSPQSSRRMRRVIYGVT